MSVGGIVYGGLSIWSRVGSGRVGWSWVRAGVELGGMDVEKVWLVGVWARLLEWGVANGAYAVGVGGEDLILYGEWVGIKGVVLCGYFHSSLYIVPTPDTPDTPHPNLPHPN